jgi:hypothetical protein
MTDTHPIPEAPSPRSGALTLVLFLVGFVLVLPGLCSVVFAVRIAATDNVIRLATRDPYFQMVLILWAICLVPTISGIFLIRYALRRNRARGESTS